MELVEPTVRLGVFAMRIQGCNVRSIFCELIDERVKGKETNGDKKDVGGAETCSEACRTCWRGTRRTAKALEFLRLGRERTANGSRRASQGRPHKLSAERTRPSWSWSSSQCMVPALLVAAVGEFRIARL